MTEELIREIESMHEAEYQEIRLRLKQVGLHHMAFDTLREHFEAPLTIRVELTLIDALSILAAAEDAKVHPDIILQFLARTALPSGYYFRGAEDLLRQLEATANAVSALNAQGIPYQGVSPVQLKEAVQRNLEKMAGTGREGLKG